MATLHTIKQLEERNVASEINLMVWSDRMDLVALSNSKGEVALHRLTWTKAWTLIPPKENLTVKNLAWRPDGKIIAVAYSSGQVLLVKVEDKNILHSIETKSGISAMHWIQEKILEEKLTRTTDKEDEQTNCMQHIDYSSKYLPELSSQMFESSNSRAEENKKCHILQDQNELNLLLIGTTDGSVHVSIFGCFPCAKLNLTMQLEHKCSIENINFSEDLSKMFVTVRDVEGSVKIILLNSDILSLHKKELFAIALKRVKLMSLVNYLTNTITTITETWESILLEMDNKLSKYASKVADGGVTADFLDLLLFGICSDEMKEFLIHDLTKKGLEKFGQTIEMSYSSIQKLLLKYVVKLGQNITYHLAELRGMARLEHRYKNLGLLEQAVTKAILSNGAFLIKGGEMQQIINHSVINYKAFFRWLYTAIIHLMDEQIPNEIPKMTQQDLAYITEFLQNFDHIGSKTPKEPGFIMERVGQYLSDNFLSIHPNMSGNSWTHFIAQDDCIKDHPNIFKHFENLSLVQQYEQLKNSIDDIFLTPTSLINEEFKILHTFNCLSSENKHLIMSEINIGKDGVLFAFVDSKEEIFVLRINTTPNCNTTRCGKFYFPQAIHNQQLHLKEGYRIIDMKFYSTSLLSLLLQEDTDSKLTILYQLPLTSALNKFSCIENTQNKNFNESEVPKINGSVLTPKLLKIVEGMTASQFAVSGSRRVGIVLSENRRKMRLFEMEAEEDDEDADMTTRESDASMQDNSTK